MNKQNDNELITTLNNLLNSLNILDKKFNEYFKRTAHFLPTISTVR